MATFGQLLTITERLPPEITCEIFILCAPAMSPMLTRDSRDTDNHFQHDISIPLRLSSVCRLWRSIAQSTPALWTSFRIYNPSRHFPERIQHAQQWLSRSGQLPLSIQIRSHPRVTFDQRDPLFNELICLVNSYSHRWGSLYISVDSRLLLPNLLSKSTTILKAVAYLSYGRFNPFYVWLLEIHWNNINHFTARYMGIGQALEILRLFTQLQEYSLVGLFENDDNIPLPSSPLQLPHLETLLVDISEPVLDGLIDNINVPSLKNFEYNGNDHILSCDSICELLNRPRCLLNTFSLKYANITAEEITLLLFAMPYLGTLILGPPSTDILRCGEMNFSVQVPWVTDRMLDILAATAEISADDQYESFLPNLQSLKYTGCVTFSWECIPLIFGGRRVKEPGSSKGYQRPLHSLTMELYPRNLDPDLDPGVISELERLVSEEGYEIQISDVQPLAVHAYNSK